MTADQFITSLSSSGYTISETQLRQLERYCVLLQEWNQKMNLTAINETEEIYEKHFLDCIMALNDKVSGKVIDVGSGAGFPGMVWKIVRPELKMTLLEPTQKRCRFLNEVIRQLDLKEIEVISERAEDHVRKKREYYDTVTARAVANMNVLSELCLPLLREKGAFIAMKGAAGKEELRAAEKAISLLGGSVQVAEREELNGAVRYNITIQKVKKTPEKYPRRYDQIKKKPL